MALENCKIVQDVSADQIVGQADITSAVLYIEPDEGYVVAAEFFEDNTQVTYPENVGKINMPCVLSDTGTPSTIGNKVKIVVDFSDTYSVSVDTTLNIDIDGKATPDNERNITAGLIEDLSGVLISGVAATNITIVPESDVTHTTYVGCDGSPSLLTNPLVDNIHYFNTNVDPGVQKKLATITFATTLPSGFVNYFASQPSKYSIGDGTGFSKFELIPNYDSFFQTQTLSALGSVPTQYVFDLLFTDTTDVDSDYTPELSMVSGGFHDGYVVAVDARILQTSAFISGLGGDTDEVTGVVSEGYSIVNVVTNFEKFNNGGGNIIPTSGINKSNQPTVHIIGVPNSTFDITFRETKVIEYATDRALGTGGIGTFDGEIPDMPVGTVKIPRSGEYLFKFPEVSALSSSFRGWKEFEMVITASSDTTITDNVMHIGGSIKNSGAVSTKITNKFYQYPRVNIKIEMNKNSGWTFQGTDHLGTTSSDTTYYEFGGTGTDKTGKAGMYVSDLSWLGDGVLSFDVRVEKSASEFSLNIQNTYDVLDKGGVYWYSSFRSDMFKVNNQSSQANVSFSKLRAHIGDGLDSTAIDHATVLGTIKFNRFGVQDTTYTLDLTEVFNNS